MPKLFGRLASVVPVRVIVFWVSASLLMAGVSAILAHMWAVGPSVHVPWRLVVVCALTSFVGLLSLLVAINLLSSDWLKQNLIPFFDPLTRQHIVHALWASLVITFLCFVVGIRMVQAGVGPSALLVAFVNNPGGLFALFSGIATFVGIYVTLQSVLEFRQTITTFPQLVDRVCDLIDSTVKSGSPSEFVRFLAYTPLTGSLALEDRDWRRIRDKIINHADRLQIVCLKQDDLAGMHQLYLDRTTDQGKITQARIDALNKDVAWLIALPALSDPGKVMRKAMDRMPRYYLFANDRRAIIAVPIFLPLPIDGLSKDAVLEMPPVHMFGFETSDLGIVRCVRKMFEIYQKQVPDDGAAVLDLRASRGPAKAEEKVPVTGAQGTEVPAAAGPPAAQA